MFRRQKTGSVLCPSCGQLVGVNDEECLSCGRKRPGLWGFTGPLRTLARGEAFVPFVVWACAAVYLATLAADPSGVNFDGLGILAPSTVSIARFGAAGYVPVFALDRWWTPLSAGWLHGGVVHIGFNLLAIRSLGPFVSSLYGASRTVLVYVIGSVCGFLASSLAQYVFRGYPWPLGGAGYTLGASAAVFALIGAVLHYGRRRGSSLMRGQAVQWMISGVVIGFFPGVDNWAHMGGLAGGYLVAIWLDPLKPERGDHAAMAAIALVLSLGAVLASLLVPLPEWYLQIMLRVG
jgi:rhomboid protease GluP